MKTYGRKTIYVNFTEKELLSMPIEQQNAKILEFLPDIIAVHDQNKLETDYLWGYLKGQQDVLNKEKYTRPEINNKTVENWCYAFVDFKKCWQLGKPIQYVMLNDSSNEEISALNQYARYENKKAKDLLIYEDVLVAGRGFRFTNFDEKGEEDEAPFSLININNRFCEVVYTSKLGNGQVFSILETPMQDIRLGEDGNPYFYEYSDYTIYLKNRAFTVTTKNSGYQIVEGSEIAIVLNDHCITEYYVNRDRISLIEIGKDLFDDINYLESLDKDDMEQFVNALMVFTNAEIDEEEFEAIKALGAVSIKSTENRKASVELLQARLNASETQTYYTRLVTSLHQILGIPMAGDSGSVTSGDTGKAKLTGQGFTSAGIRAEGDETMLSMCDQQVLKKILKICRESADSKIKNLRASDIDIKFQRDMSDNLLVKTQGLLNLLAADIPREYALPIVNLFSDSNAVVKKMQEMFGDQTTQQKAKKEGEEGENSQLNPEDNSKFVNINDKADYQNNKLNNKIEQQTQNN